MTVGGTIGRRSVEDANGHDVTEMLVRAAGGDDSASEALLPLLYDELRAMARGIFQRQAPGHTLQPTALVHEAFIKLTGRRRMDWESRAHFLAVASMAMRQILANHAERKRTAKRGGGGVRVTLAGLGKSPESESAADLIDLDDALTKLADLSPRQARIVEMKFLAGGEDREVAEALDVSASTVRRQWQMALAFLNRELSRGD
jgi:RNA polymerase sigma factor (TIGR02999 family)